jgi:four helix bundle protein
LQTANSQRLKAKYMRNFRKLDIWISSIELAKKVYLISDNLPTDERFGLKSQIQRAAVSIPSNIAEGASRSSEKEFRYFLEIAIGSSFELETQLFLIKELSLIKDNIDDEIFTKLETIQKQLNALISKLKQQQ